MSVGSRIIVLGAAGGALGALCWLPFGLAPVLPLALLPAAMAARTARSGADAVRIGLAYGVSTHVVGAHYVLALVSYSPLAVLIYLLDILYAVPFAVLAFWGAHRLERAGGLPPATGLLLAVPIVEWTKTLGDASVPSDLVAHAFGTNPAWLAWTAWTGPYLMSVLAFGVAILLDAAIRRRGERGRAAACLASAVVLWCAPPATDAIMANERASTGSGLRVGIVQPSVTIQEKLDRDRWPGMWTRLRDLTSRAAAGADLVVWPETSRPGPVFWPVGEPFGDREMEALAGEFGTPILYGCEIVRTDDRGPFAIYNGAAIAYPDGRPGDWYGKQKLLPFVEGVPFSKLFGRDPIEARRTRTKKEALTLWGNFIAGDRATLFEVGEARIGVLICYEGLYPQLTARYRRAGANALLVMTNDIWWGHTVFAPWHAKMIATRAREANVPAVRAANSGVSSITGRAGRMGASTDLFDVTTLRVALHPSDGPATFYAAQGDLLVAALWIGVAACAVRGIVRRRRTQR